MQPPEKKIVIPTEKQSKIAGWLNFLPANDSKEIKGKM